MTMRALVYDTYGPPEVLGVQDVPVPEPGAREVLVAVVATSVNLSDWECLVGRPAYARIGGLRHPAVRILGSDIAGRVVAVGADVSEFEVGDEVYGDNLTRKGGFAEYAVIDESNLAPKPAGLSFAQASTIPQAGAIALQGTAGAGPGQRLLINGDRPTHTPTPTTSAPTVATRSTEPCATGRGVSRDPPCVPARQSPRGTRARR